VQVDGLALTATLLDAGGATVAELAAGVTLAAGGAA
jgi:hypothetical protein